MESVVQKGWRRDKVMSHILLKQQDALFWNKGSNWNKSFRSECRRILTFAAIFTAHTGRYRPALKYPQLSEQLLGTIFTWLATKTSLQLHNELLWSKWTTASLVPKSQQFVCMWCILPQILNLHAFASQPEKSANEPARGM